MRPGAWDRQTLRRSRIVAGATLLVMLGPACSDNSAGADDFRAQADQICRRAENEINTLAKPTNPARAQPFLEKVDSITRTSLKKLDAIQPPEEVAGDFQNMIDLLKVALFYQPQLREAVKRQSVPAAQEVRTKIASALEDAQEIARSLELEVCAAGRPPE